MEPNESNAKCKKSKQREGIIITKQTIDKLLNHDQSNDMIALYMFYTYTALWQRTNQPHATLRYVMRGLNWGKDRVRAVRSLLRDRGIIGDVADRDPVTKRVR